MRRALVDEVKAEANRLLKKIEELEALAGWTRYTQDGNQATSKQHPDDSFTGGEYTASVRRASMDLTKALARLRRG